MGDLFAATIVNIGSDENSEWMLDLRGNFDKQHGCFVVLSLFLQNAFYCKGKKVMIP
jgi:hypothetical protein